MTYVAVRAHGGAAFRHNQSELLQSKGYNPADYPAS
jgi:hypothetical protein